MEHVSKAASFLSWLLAALMWGGATWLSGCSDDPAVETETPVEGSATPCEESNTSSCTTPDPADEDLDDDGFSENKGDCEPEDEEIYPGAPELCDDVDNDCDGSKDEGIQITYYLDGDGDGYGGSTSSVQSCTKPSGYSTVSGDCNDSNATVNPGAVETCDGIDNDCDAKVDAQDGLTCKVKALIYYDSGATFADDAVALRSGGTSILATSTSTFATAYDVGGFDVIIVDAPSTLLESSVITRLTSWVTMGKPLIFAWWDLDTNSALQTTLGVKVVADRASFTPIYPASTSSINLWTLYESVPVPLSGSDQATDNGDTIMVTEADGRLLGSFGSSTSGQGAVALTKRGKVIVNAFLPWDTQTVDLDFDGRPDMTELYVNQLKLLGF